MQLNLISAFSIFLPLFVIATSQQVVNATGKNASCSDIILGISSEKFSVTDYSKTFTNKFPPFTFNLPSNYRLVKYSNPTHVYVLNPEDYKAMECIKKERLKTDFPEGEFHVAIHSISQSLDIKQVVLEIEGEDNQNLEVALSTISKVKFGVNAGYSYETDSYINDVPTINTMFVDPTGHYVVVFSRMFLNTSSNADDVEKSGNTAYSNALKSLTFKSYRPSLKFRQLKNTEIKNYLSVEHYLPVIPKSFQNGLVIGDFGASTMYLYILDEKIESEELGVFNEYVFDSKIPSLSSFSKINQEQMDKLVEAGKAIEIRTICRSSGTASFCFGKPEDYPWTMIDQPNTAFYNGLAIHATGYTSEEISAWHVNFEKN